MIIILSSILFLFADGFSFSFLYFFFVSFYSIVIFFGIVVFCFITLFIYFLFCAPLSKEILLFNISLNHQSDRGDRLKAC